MNDPIENALKNMKPAELPPALMARLTAARSEIAAPKVEEPVRGVGFLQRWLWPVAVCALAAMGTVTWLNTTQPKPGGPMANANPSGAQPVAARNEVPFESEARVLGTREVGIVIGPNQRPIRLMEVDWVESNTVPPANGQQGVRGETLRRSVVPMALEIY